MQRTPPSPHTVAAAFAGVLLAASPLPAEQVEGLSLPVTQVTVSSPVQEIVAEVFVDEGDTVTAGQPLARLLDEKERIGLERAAKVLEKREFDNTAAQTLAGDKLLSREKALESAAELDLARLDRDLAETLLNEKTIRSPIDGIVVRKVHEAGESVDRVGPLFHIVDTRQLYLQFYLSPDQVAGVSPGQAVPFRVEALAGETFTGTVDFVSPAADPSSGLFRIKLLFENPDGRIAAGLRVTAELGAGN